MQPHLKPAQVLDPDSHYAKEWPGNPSLVKLKDNLILVIPPQHHQFPSGNINALEPVFMHLGVWQDINGDGVVPSAELLGTTVISPKKVATYAFMTGTGGQFDYRNLVAANELTWGVAA